MCRSTERLTAAEKVNVRRLMSVVLSCITDGSPKYDYQALVWATTLLQLAGREPSELLVHTTGAVTPLLARIEELGVEVAPLEPFDPEWPLAHKIGLLASPAIRARAPDHVVFTDCDLAFAGDPVPWANGTFRAKPVDLTKPPIAVWQELFQAEGFAEQPEEWLPTNAPGPTYARNVNAGVLMVPSAMLEGLGQCWARWYRHAQRHGSILGQDFSHLVQISLALALRELGVVVDPLPLGLNLPTHLGRSRLGHVDEEPICLHYHERVDTSGFLELTGSPAVDAAIERINGVLAAATARVYPSENVARVERPPDRGKARTGLRRRLALLIAALAPDSS